MQRFAIAWGEVLWDLFPDGPKLGGAPANVAYHLALLGCPVAMVSRVGDDDAGREAVARLTAAGVDCRGVQVDRERPTGAVEVALEDREPRYRLRPGCAWERIAFDEVARDLSERAAALVFGSLAQRDAVGRGAWREAVATAARGSQLRVCDLNLRPGQFDLEIVDLVVDAANVVKLNDGEVASLAAAYGVADVVAYLRRERGVEVVAVTRGAGGCVLHRDGERVEHPGCAARAGGDNVGCGDAFTAVLTRGLLAGDALADIAELGCRYGAHVASERGATPAPPPWLSAPARAARGRRP